MKLLQLVQAAAGRLDRAGVAFGHGTTNAFDEAAWLVLWQLGLPLDTDLAGDGATATDDIPEPLAAKVDALIARRIETREPAAYLTGEAWLSGVRFHVDRRVIVPRSFIAELLENGEIDPWLTDRTQRVLDLCTGNGSLAVLAAMAYPDISVDAADISTDALAVARINVDAHGLGDRITLIASDGLDDAPGPYDLILCNPPYVNAASMAALPPEFLAEPGIALAGGADGMDFIRRLLADAPGRMAPGAVLVLEIGNERAHFEAAFPDLAAVWLQTSAGEDQVLLLTRENLT